MTRLESIINEAFDSLDLEDDMVTLKGTCSESKLLCIIEHTNAYSQACDDWNGFLCHIQELGYLSDDEYFDAVISFQTKEESSNEND